MLENLELKVTEENRTLHKNSLTLMHKNKNIKSVYFEETNKILNDLHLKYKKKCAQCRLQSLKRSLKIHSH